MSFEVYALADIKDLVKLAIDNKLKRLKIGDIEIEPDLSEVGAEEKINA